MSLAWAHDSEFDRQTDLVVSICEIDKNPVFGLKRVNLWSCLGQLKKIYGWKIWFEYNYLQSLLVIVRIQTEALFTASLT